MKTKILMVVLTLAAMSAPAFAAGQQSDAELSANCVKASSEHTDKNQGSANGSDSKDTKTSGSSSTGN